jgi:internalin A
MAVDSQYVATMPYGLEVLATYKGRLSSPDMLPSCTTAASSSTGLGLLAGRVVLDQNWALEAIYALFDREKAFPVLDQYGRFTRRLLERLIWSSYRPEDQRIFLGMMESCGICFPVRELPPDSPEEHGVWEDKECEYLAPELLPPWSDTEEQLLGRL